MKLEDYTKYYIQGSDHYLIPKNDFVELFNEMVNWKEESIELNKKYVNAVSDYETTMIEKEQLKKQIKKLSQWDTDKDTRNSRQRVANAKLLKENQELKKQLENKYEKVGTLTNELLYEENTKLINQQKEFINYLNSYIDLLNDKPDMLEEIQKDILEEILQKYKKIIGVSDEKK